GRFLQFPIGDRRCKRTRASVSKRPVTRAQALTNATLAAAGLLHRRSPTAPCSKGALAAHRKKLAAFSALGGDCGSQRGPGSVIILRTISRSALTSAIRRFVSSPLSACADALNGGQSPFGLRLRALLQLAARRHVAGRTDELSAACTPFGAD